MEKRKRIRFGQVWLVFTPLNNVQYCKSNVQILLVERSLSRRNLIAFRLLFSQQLCFVVECTGFKLPLHQPLPLPPNALGLTLLNVPSLPPPPTLSLCSYHRTDRGTLSICLGVSRVHTHTQLLCD